MNLMKSINENSDKKYIIISQIDIINNGSVEQLSTIKNPNEIGSVMDDSNNCISQITALIMIINRNSINDQAKIDSLIQIGADPHLKIDYYGKRVSAFELASNYRSNLIL